MNQWARGLVRRGIARVPPGIKDAVFETFINRFGARNVLERLAARENIKTFGCDGEYGRIVSATTDRSVLAYYARHQTWARRSNSFFQSFFAERGGTYLDLGANIGLTTIPQAQNPRVRCVSFEPDPTNFQNLTDNLCRNAPDANVTLHNVALYHQNTTLTFSLAADGNLGDHRISYQAPDRRSIQVQARRLDDLIGPVTTPLGVKMDVQGAEPFVLAGGAATFKQVQALVMEFSPFHMAALNADGTTILDYLANFKSLACVNGDTDEIPTFGPASPVIDRLRYALNDASGDEMFYLDVYGLRDG